MNHKKINIYLIPGQGADERLFNNLYLPDNYTIKKIRYNIPRKGSSMKEYAKYLSLQINTTAPFILIGVSLGGMLATEISELHKPLQTILISSAKTRLELPFSYRFQRDYPLYRIFPPGIMKLGAQVLQPIVEPDSKKERATFNAMLRDKNPKFLSRTIHMIINWSREKAPEGIIHIHGNKDNTLPVKNVSADHIIKSGSHMMTLTRGAEISEIVKGILKAN